MGAALHLHTADIMRADRDQIKVAQRSPGPRDQIPRALKNPLSPFLVIATLGFAHRMARISDTGTHHPKCDRTDNNDAPVTSWVAGSSVVPAPCLSGAPRASSCRPWPLRPTWPRC